MAKKAEEDVKEDEKAMGELRGHKKMVVWQNMDKLDTMIQRIIKKIPKTRSKLIAQIDNASDSVGANFVEGYYSGSLAEYLRFLRYSKRSLGELQERIRRVLRKGYIIQEQYDEFNDLSIRTMYLLDRLMQSLRKKAAEGRRRRKKS